MANVMSTAEVLVHAEVMASMQSPRAANLKLFLPTDSSVSIYAGTFTQLSSRSFCTTSLLKHLVNIKHEERVI